jgi:hypothetical protein
MSETNKEIAGIYEELKGVLASIQDASSWFDDEGFTAQVNGIIARVPGVCPEIQDIDSYVLRAGHIPNLGAIVNTPQAKSKLSALVGRIKGTYSLDVSNSNSGHTFVQNQTQSQSLSVVLDLQERILTELPKHAEGTKERGFLEKLKSALPTVKNMTDILSSALKIGTELGLDPATIHKLLNL